MLTDIFSRVLLVSVMAAVLTVLILLVKALFKEKLSARWHYYIWFLLVARLVIPYTPEFSPNFDGFAAPVREGIKLQTEGPPAGSMHDNPKAVLPDRGEIRKHDTGGSLESNDKKGEAGGLTKQGDANHRWMLMAVPQLSRI